MSREKRPKKSVGTMNGWENCDVPAENHTLSLSLSFFIFHFLAAVLFSFCPILDDGEVPTILLHFVSEASPGSGPESSSLRCRGQILRLLSARKK